MPDTAETAAPTPLAMPQHVPARVVDGTVQLTWAQGSPLRLQRSQHQHECFVAGAYKRAHREHETPETCQRVITPGLYYVAHFPRTEPANGRDRLRYCAPCAIREWTHFDVREVPA